MNITDAQLANALGYFDNAARNAAKDGHDLISCLRIGLDAVAENLRAYVPEGYVIHNFQTDVSSCWKWYRSAPWNIVSIKAFSTKQEAIDDAIRHQSEFKEPLPDKFNFAVKGSLVMGEVIRAVDGTYFLRYSSGPSAWRSVPSEYVKESLVLGAWRMKA